MQDGIGKKQVIFANEFLLSFLLLWIFTKKRNYF